MEETPHHSKSKVNWKEVGTFYLLACLFSWPFFVWRDIFPEEWNNSVFPSTIKKLGLMWGPGLSAIVCFQLFKKTHNRSITWFGSSIAKSLIFYLSPFVIWVLIALINPSDLTINAMGIVHLVPFGFLMIVGEELGWRGYLQDSLKALPEPKRWIILGLLWEFWHFTRGMINGEVWQIVLRKAFLIIIVMALTFLIGKSTNRTKSLLVAVTFHSWFNIVTEFPHINTAVAASVSIILWFILMRRWESQNG